MMEMFFENIMNTINSVNPMVWIGGGVFLLAIGYVIWIIRERF